MSYGYVEDGEFYRTDDKNRATKCDLCGYFEEKRAVKDDSSFDLLRASALGFDDYTGHANICKNCLVEGIGEEGRQKLKENVFEEKEDTVEL